MAVDERALLLLGLLTAQSQHGYQINEFIEKSLSPLTDMKKSTAYAILDRLADAGFVTVQTQPQGNRPPRKVYSITPAGEQHFFSLLRDGLAAQGLGVFSGDVALMFVDHLSDQDKVACLRSRRDAVLAELEKRRRMSPHGFGHGVDLVMDHQIALLEAEAEWIYSAINRLAAP